MFANHTKKLFLVTGHSNVFLELFIHKDLLSEPAIFSNILLYILAHSYQAAGQAAAVVF